MSKDRSNVENFVVFGTAFPEQTEKDKRAGRSDAGQFVPVWKQEARDEKGRRRFHGAFTGGFSAGYFNTVGSKEGWEPSNYTSSRNARNDRKEARPEDFMDEEDLQDLAGARRLVATEEFDVLGGTERELAARQKLQQQEEERGGGLGVIGTSLMDMFGPPKDSVGIRLLRKMGWRPGQGIGPRVIKRRLDDDDASDDDDDFLKDATFAPRDTPIESYQPKRDTYGLGFDLVSSVPEVAEMKRLRELARQQERDGNLKDKKNRSAFGGSASGDAFGLGAFEDDDDDNDVYKDDGLMNKYHTTLYDDEGGYTREQLKRKREQVEESSASQVKCSDGRPPLKGFHVSTQKQQIGEWFPPPQVPADFTGVHVMKEEATDAKTKISGENMFSFEERGRALDEKPIEQRSVFDYMPQHSKDRLERAVSYFVDLGKDKSKLSDFPTITKEVANLALKGFIPFGDNPKKQARYKRYLEDQAGRLTEDGFPNKTLPIPEGMTFESGMKELDEFAKAARIFRPISSMMSSRFTSASDAKNVEVISFEGGLKTEEQYRKEKEEKAKLVQEPAKKQLSQEAEAAAMKMFGSLTRTVKPFYPNRLVCKRFNVRNPHPDHDPLADNAVGRTQAGSKEALSKESMETLLNQRLPLVQHEEPKSNDPLLTAVIPKPSERSDTDTTIAPTTVEAAQAQVDEEEEGKELDYERPSMDIFKAIFDDSDSEEEEPEPEPEEEDKKEVQPMEEDDFIGPPLPPPSATAEIPITTNEPEESIASFRPMFKRASDRRERSEPVTEIMSEEVIVQPFKPRHSNNKRRRVSVSEEEEEEEEEKHRDRSRDRSRDRKSRKSNSSSSKRKEERKSSKHRSSRSHHKREDSRSRSSHRRDSSRSRKDDRRHRRDSSRSRKEDGRSSRKHKKSVHITEEDLFEGMWVEKEPVKPIKKPRERMNAADMW